LLPEQQILKIIKNDELIHLNTNMLFENCEAELKSLSCNRSDAAHARKERRKSRI
jgi:hypothetical protein